MKVTLKHAGRSAGELATLIGEMADVEIVQITYRGEYADVTYRAIPAGHTNDDVFLPRECVMCGKERPLNEEGYCSNCWIVWKS